MEKEKEDVRLLSVIKGYSTSNLPVGILKEIGRDNPREGGLCPYRYRLQLKDLSDGQGRFREGDECKMTLANSCLQRTNVNLETLARRLDEWIPSPIPWRPNYFYSWESLEYRYLNVRHSFFVDYLFIVEVIRRYTCGDSQDATDGLNSIGLFAQARCDLLVHGNSPPFVVLEGLFCLAFPGYATSPDRNFSKLCVAFFSESMLIATDRQALAAINRLQQQRSSSPEIEDLLDFVRKCHAPLFPRQPPSDPMKLTAMRKANYLEEAGMTISPASTTSVCSIHYRQGRLEIPKLKINSQSEHLLVNLIQHEMEHYPRDTFISDYLHFMVRLVDTEKDVEVLIQNDILDNFFTDSIGVAALFNKVTREAPLLIHTYYYHGISEAVNAYCSIRRHRWKATLRRDYCSSPWMIASTIAAIILLVLTLIQTVCSIISVIHG